MKLLILVFCFVSCVLFGAVDGITFEDLKHEYVLINSPENIHFYYISATNIVVGWDLHQIYHPYDVNPHEFSNLKNEDGIKVTKPQARLIAVNASTLNETSTEEKNETDSSARETASDVTKATPTDKNQDANDATGKESEKDSQKKNPWICHPATFFANYTIDTKQDPGPFDNAWGVSIVNMKKHVPVANITLRRSGLVSQQLVPFSLGCVTKYEVIYQPPDKKSIPAKTITVEPHTNLVEIKGLTEMTRYNIIVQAVYVNDVTLKSHSIFVHTLQDEAKPLCNCDASGIVEDQGNSCLNKTDGGLCQCKPEYQGQFCEVCAPSYHRTSRSNPCTRCPCDEYSKKQSDCHFEEGFLICDGCEIGYTGNTCHKCSPGYYRHENKCVNCACSGNSDPNIPHMCEAETGMCIGCIRNTTGFHCERCLPGYHGSAVTYRNCSLINEAGGFSLSPGIIVAITIVVLLCIACIGFILFKRLQSHKRRHAFWTVEMRRDNDDVDFNSVQNEDAHLDDLDDLEFYEHHGGTTAVSKYSRLNDQA